MIRKFFNKNTQFNPEYRNVQAELWQVLTDEQQKQVALVFCHLKNHSQIEIADALLDYVHEGIIPEVTDWSNIFNAIQFNYILYRAFGVDITKSLPK